MTTACDPVYGPVPVEFYFEHALPLGDPVMEYLHSD